MPILFGHIQLAQRRIFTGEGDPFARTPPRVGFALCGLVVGLGPRLARVTPLFAELSADGCFGAEVEGPPAGGESDAVARVRVRRGCVAVGLQLRIDARIEAVRLIEAPFRDGTLGPLRAGAWAGPARGVVHPPVIAERGGLMVGIAGRAGRHVDALTPILAQPFPAADADDERAGSRSLG